MSWFAWWSPTEEGAEGKAEAAEGAEGAGGGAAAVPGARHPRDTDSDSEAAKEGRGRDGRTSRFFDGGRGGGGRLGGGGGAGMDALADSGDDGDSVVVAVEGLEELDNTVRAWSSAANDQEEADMRRKKIRSRRRGRGHQRFGLRNPSEMTGRTGRTTMATNGAGFAQTMASRRAAEIDLEGGSGFLAVPRRGVSKSTDSDIEDSDGKQDSSDADAGGDAHVMRRRRQRGGSNTSPEPTLRARSYNDRRHLPMSTDKRPATPASSEDERTPKRGRPDPDPPSKSKLPLSHSLVKKRASQRVQPSEMARARRKQHSTMPKQGPRTTKLLRSKSTKRELAALAAEKRLQAGSPPSHAQRKRLVATARKEKAARSALVSPSTSGGAIDLTGDTTDEDATQAPPAAARRPEDRDPAMFTQLEGAAWIAFDKLLIPDKVEVSGSELFARVHGAGDKWALGDIRHYWSYRTFEPGSGTPGTFHLAVLVLGMLKRSAAGCKSAVEFESKPSVVIAFRKSFQAEAALRVISAREEVKAAKVFVLDSRGQRATLQQVRQMWDHESGIQLPRAPRTRSAKKAAATKIASALQPADEDKTRDLICYPYHPQVAIERGLWTEERKLHEQNLAELEAEGKAGSRPSVTIIVASDLDKLAPGEFLNDNLIDFGIRFAMRREASAVLETEIHAFSSFFFSTLGREKVGARAKRQEVLEAGYARVKRWAKDVKLFNQRFWIIPIHQAAHWSLAIVCYPSSIRRKDESQWTAKERGEHAEEGGHWPCILFMDSLELHKRSKVETYLHYYIFRELKKAYPKKGFELNEMRYTIPIVKCKVPQQDNHCDCGVYTLLYTQVFLKKCDELIFDDSTVTRKGAATYEWRETSIYSRLSDGLAATERERLQTMITEMAISAERTLLWSKSRQASDDADDDDCGGMDVDAAMQARGSAKHANGADGLAVEAAGATVPLRVERIEDSQPDAPAGEAHAPATTSGANVTSGETTRRSRTTVEPDFTPPAGASHPGSVEPDFTPPVGASVASSESDFDPAPPSPQPTTVPDAD